MVTDFGENRRKLSETPSFCVLSFHSGWEDRTVNARVNTADDLSTADNNLVKSRYVLSIAIFLRSM